MWFILICGWEIALYSLGRIDEPDLAIQWFDQTIEAWRDPGSLSIGSGSPQSLST
jgi:hypothetical protein